MSDVQFLIWLHDRLVIVHDENPNYDYMRKLRAIIENMPANRKTTSECRSNNLAELITIVNS